MHERPLPPRPSGPPFRYDPFAVPAREEIHLRIDALERHLIWISVTVAGLTSVITTLLVLMVEQL